MLEFNRGHGQMDVAGTHVTRATACLPGLDIEMVHRRAVEGDTERIFIVRTTTKSLWRWPVPGPSG
jgi:hypothetical protein